MYASLSGTDSARDGFILPVFSIPPM